MVQARKDDVIVRLRCEADANKLKKAEALQSCGFLPAPSTFPKIIIFGTSCATGEDLMRDIFDQNRSIRGEYEIDSQESAFAEFSEFFLPERCRPAREKGA